MAKSQIAKDAAEGKEEAKMLLGKVGRKTVKQTVMTTVYGEDNFFLSGMGAC